MVANNDALAKRFFENGIHATGATTIMRPAADLYAVWRKMADLPRFIDHLVKVETVSETRSRWTVRGPGGREYSWESEIIQDEPDRVIAWTTVGSPGVPNAGSIRFRELSHGRGTEVKVAIEYLPPGGRLGDAVARIMGDDARSQIHEALHRFRQVMETGEIPTTKQQPVGANARRHDRPGEKDRRETEADVRSVAGLEAGI